MPKAPLDHIEQAKGVDKSGRPHQVEQGKWWDSLNYRHRAGEVTQIPRKVQYAKCAPAIHNRVTAIVSLPIKHQNRVMVLFFCGGKVYRLKSDQSVIPINGDNTFRSGGPVARWATVVHDDKVYFTNPLSPVAYTNGATAYKFSGNVPCAYYITMFFDHLVVGRVNHLGAVIAGRIMWSDLYKIGSWDAKRSNEADRYDMLESATANDEIGGVTGLARMNQEVVIYTPTVIYHMVYVGLPRVMHIEQRWSGVGCDMVYGLVSLETLHFFPNKRLRNFFQYSPGSYPKVVGDSIANFFFDDLSTDTRAQQMTWGFVDELNNEAVWVYISKASTLALGYDFAIVYNIQENIWYRMAVENISAFGGQGAIGKVSDEIVST